MAPLPFKAGSLLTGSEDGFLCHWLAPDTDSSSDSSLSSDTGKVCTHTHTHTHARAHVHTPREDAAVPCPPLAASPLPKLNCIHQAGVSQSNGHTTHTASGMLHSLHYVFMVTFTLHVLVCIVLSAHILIAVHHTFHRSTAGAGSTSIPPTDTPIGAPPTPTTGCSYPLLGKGLIAHWTPPYLLYCTFVLLIGPRFGAYIQVLYITAYY